MATRRQCARIVIPTLHQDGNFVGCLARSSPYQHVLMKWTHPPSQTASQWARMDFPQTIRDKGGWIRGEGYDGWNRLGKVCFSPSRSGCTRRQGFRQEAVPLQGFARQRERLVDMDERIEALSEMVEVASSQDEACQRLERVRGIGALAATALRSAVGSARQFKNGREMAAWLGLTPRQHSTGGKTRLLGISKRGDRYIRTLLIHGA